MIQGRNYTLLEIPGTGSEQVADFFEKHLGGVPITPKFSREDSTKGRLTFTIIREPVSRMKSLYYSYNQSAQQGGFIDWYEGLKNKEDYHSILKPYDFWTTEKVKVVRLENLKEELALIFKAIGRKAVFNQKLFVDEKYPKLLTEEVEYIKKERKEDFLNHLYPLTGKVK